MSEYIIRYKFGDYSRWNYFVKIARKDELSSDTCSTISSESEVMMKMSLTKARDNIIKIKKIRIKYYEPVTEIQILNAETNEIMDNKEREPVSRFELMDI